METMTKKTKIILGSVGGGLLALAIVLGIWQPWKKPAENPPVTPPVQDQQPDKEPGKDGLTLTVGGEKIPCTLYEGDGWSIYVPEGWTAEANETGGVFFLKENGRETARLEVTQSVGSGYAGSFISASGYQLSETAEQRSRLFYAGTTQDAWEVLCQAPEADWSAHQRLMTAVARTLTVGEEQPFAELYPVASEPDWQVADGKTVLWMDKDGYVVNDEMEKAVEAEMTAWDDSFKALHTGKYRLEDLRWAADYTCLPGKEYVDIFSAQVWYGLTEAGAAGIAQTYTDPDRLEVKDGWYTDHRPLYLAVFHDGGVVNEVRTIETQGMDLTVGSPLMVSLMLMDDPDSAVPLTPDQLKQCADYFNAPENNGLLRFAYESETQVGGHLGILFYDLGESGDKVTEAERSALEQAGFVLETDVFKLSRDYVLGYLREKLGLADLAEELVNNASNPPGTYLEAYKAWYQCHGDTAMQTYTFDRGEFYASLGGCVRLYYTTPYLFESGDGGRFDVPMTVTLTPSGEEPGKWWVTSNMEVKKEAA